MNPSIFKAYDIRGIYPSEIDEQGAYRIAKAIYRFLAKERGTDDLTLVVGSDVRLSSPSLKRAAMKALTDAGAKVVDVGSISTDMLYFAVAEYGYDGGFTVTASHNPKEYNGMKIVREGGQPISSDSGLFEIRDDAKRLEIPDGTLKNDPDRSLIEEKVIMDDYAKKVRSFADLSKLKPFKIVANPNFGVGGVALDRITEGLGLDIVKLNYEPDGNFPKGRPDPLIPENQEEISALVVEQGADFGVAWDADADRCFFFTEKGQFIEGYFITALLSRIFLERHRGDKIVHDTRLTWAIEDTVSDLGGIDLPNKAGHSFMKERMFREKAVFGGEMSAHYFFRDYYFCDCGMIPFVMILEFLSRQEKSFSEIMQELFWDRYFVSGEINSSVADVPSTVEKIRSLYIGNASKVDDRDGISLDFLDQKNDSNSWRFSVRASNTEPLIRLNVESKSRDTMERKRDELLAIIRG
ncbi:MAG: phosphomannomutase/phosphoglucomutase [Candidatus Moranbacteria bacterium]|nr:phosphomannomutase/phosphoglucomutase [Candidatus Moranbacteria bacterium]